MANASYIQPSFLGGEKSQLAQGRIDEKDYCTWMNVCVNGHPIEGGAWTRRSGSQFAGTTRGGAPGRVVKFDFAQATPYTLEFTDGFLRFRSGLNWASTDDSVVVAAISAANPAVLQTSSAVTWVSGNTIVFSSLGTSAPLLQNRQFLITKIDTTHFSLQDALTLATIDGSTLGAIASGADVSRIHEVASPYVSGSWGSVRVVQAETTGVVLQGTVPPQLLQVTTLPTSALAAQFSLSNLTFLDGPYLDPFTNGVQATPNALSGNIQLSLAFPAYSATKAYKIGDFVTSVAINYESLTDNNVNNTPAGSPSNWLAVSAGVAINNGQGFLGTDLGRLVRLFSEPPLWVAGTAYVAGNIVSYNPSGASGASTYWRALVNNTGPIPGQDTTNWAIAQNAAIWSWGKITSLNNQISQSAGVGAIGSLTANGGTAASFDGIISQALAASSEASVFFDFNGVPAGNIQNLSLDAYVGKNYTGTPKQIASATVFPPTDVGICSISYNEPGFSAGQFIQITAGPTLQINLRGKATAPTSPFDGTVIGSTVASFPFTSPVTILSSDPVTAWNFVWVEVFGTVQSRSTVNFHSTAQIILNLGTAEVQFFAPPGTGAGNAVNVEILGPPLLYTNPAITWRLGAYSNTTGWPTCGTYHEGRIWLAGAINNRFDASVSNGLSGTTLNFAPTDQNGVVGAANAVTGTVNSDGVNPIFWLTPDLQGIIMGTQAGEWLIFAPSPGAMAATNIKANRVTKIGCANVEPRKTDHTNVFVQRYSRKVMEYFTDVYSGKFAAPNLAKDALHITKPGVVELAFQSAVIPIIWGRNADGSLFGVTYKRDTLATSQGPTINGWHRHNLGSGRTVQSICVGPSVGGNLDALTMVTSTAGGLNHVEVLTDAVDEGNTLIQATYLDDACHPTSFTSSNVTPAPYGGLTLNGLWHLNGLTVQAWCGGLDCGLQENNSVTDFVVTNGSITIPYGDGISAGSAKGQFTAAFAAGLSLSQMLVGFTFTSQGQIVRPATPAESGSRNGPAVGKKRRNHKIAVQMEGTGVGIFFGTTFAKVDPAKFRLANDVAFTINQQFTGIYKETVRDDYTLDGMLCWQVTRPYPANLANIGGFVETTDE